MQADIQPFLLYLVFLSGAVERLVELFKPSLNQQRSLQQQGMKTRAYILLGFALGNVVAYLFPPPSFSLFQLPTAQFAALLATAGSGVWHDVLSIVQGFKPSNKL